MIGCLLYVCLVTPALAADDWDPHDATFDPKIESVVIGDRSWLGDPSPFVHTGLKRTGYTYVNATQFEGFPPAIQISLMVPVVPGETTPPAGGMLMMDQKQTVALVELVEKLLKSAGKADAQASDRKVEPADEKRFPISTSLPQTEWVLVPLADQDQRVLQLESKTKEKVDAYRFSFNAMKKLLGAVEHSLQKLDEQPDK